MKGGVLLDGFPRSLEQAEMLDKFAKVDLAVDLEVNEENLVKRLTLRRTCKSCNAVYHLEFNPPKKEGQVRQVRRRALPEDRRHGEDRPGASQGLQGADPAADRLSTRREGILRKSRRGGGHRRGL